jgi:hypothetical protein
MVFAALWTAACGFMSSPAGPLVHEHHDVERGTATRAKVEIGMTAGDLEVTSGAKTLFAGDFDYNVAELKPVIAYSANGETGTLEVSQGSASGNYENRWRLSLDETTPMDLDVGLGAGDVTLELGRVNLNTLTVSMGAGDLRLDLRGTPARSYTVKVQAGAGDTRIELPSTVGLSVGTSGLIGDSNVSGLEKRGDRWINPRAEASAVTITLDVQHAVGDLRISAD